MLRLRACVTKCSHMLPCNRQRKNTTPSDNADNKCLMAQEFSLGMGARAVRRRAERTWPARGVGRRCNLNEFGPYRCVVSPSRLLGKFMIWMASNGHFFTQIPQPMQSSSEIQASFEDGVTSIHNFPTLTTGQYRLHSCLHFLGLHLSELTTAIRVGVSSLSFFVFFFLGAIAPTLLCKQTEPSYAYK